jgi:mono/diheme cytochrome c family protein
MHVWLAGALAVGVSGCRSCTAQHDPTADWKKNAAEQEVANSQVEKLADDGTIPIKEVVEEVALSPTEKKYVQFCGSCHGNKGAGDGPAAAGLNPKPRNFVTWNDKTVTNEYIAKVIREGGASVGKSGNMAPWGGVLSAEEIDEMVTLINTFRGL